MRSDVDELKGIAAGRLLAIWRETREMTEDPLERSLLCNARVLAECCYHRGQRAFADAEAVLSALTGRQMESLLKRLAEGASEEVPAEITAEENPSFDRERFEALREG